jgi:hypothetical protein
MKYSATIADSRLPAASGANSEHGIVVYEAPAHLARGSRMLALISSRVLGLVVTGMTRRVCMLKISRT